MTKFQVGRANDFSQQELAAKFRAIVREAREAAGEAKHQLALGLDGSAASNALAGLDQILAIAEPLTMETLPTGAPAALTKE